MRMKRKRLVLFAAVALSALLLLVACGGVSQDDLDAVQAELASAQAAATAAAAERDQAVTDLSSEQESATRLRGYLSAATADLALVTADLASAEADLEAALAAVPEGEAGDTSFASWTWTDTLYGFSIEVLEDWDYSTAGTLYVGAYERVGYEPAWLNVPALGVYPLGPAEEDPFVYLREELTITYAEMVSETEAVLIDGAAVTVYVALMGDADSGTNVGMTVVVNGELINFTVDWSETWPWEGGGVDIATEILLSLVIDADLME